VGLITYEVLWIILILAILLTHTDSGIYTEFLISPRCAQLFRTMKRYFQILLLIFISAPAISQTTSDQLRTEFLSGQLFIFNNYALKKADPSFFRKLIKGKIITVERLDSLVGQDKYGTIGLRGVFKVQIQNLKALKREHYQVIDSSVLKYFDERNQIFYFIDGGPTEPMDQALRWLVNKRIKEVKKLGPTAAQAIWGTQGDNGAVIINTDGKIDLPMK
jgi:hypothetical protein